VLSPNPGLERLLDHVLAFGDHRRGEAHDLLDGRPADLGDLLDALAAANPRLNVARAEGTFHGDLQLALGSPADAGGAFDQAGEAAIDA